MLVARFASDRVYSLLAGHSEALHALQRLDPGIPEKVESPAPPSEPALSADASEPPEEDFVDLEHPTEKDWKFLLQTLEKGTPEARISVMRVLVTVGQLRGVRPLFENSRREAVQDPDRGLLFCAAALEILRFQLQEDALAEMLLVLDESSEPLPEGCRLEIGDRFHAAGGRDPVVVARLAENPDARVRRFAARFLADLNAPEYMETLEGLRQDPEPSVREATSLEMESPE